MTANLNVRAVALSLVDFAIANPLSKRADAISHVQTALGWKQSNTARPVIQAIEERAAEAGYIDVAGWTTLAAQFVQDGNVKAKKWVRSFLDLPEFRARPDVKLALLREQRENFDVPIEEQRVLIDAATALIDSDRITDTDELNVIKLGREAARNTRRSLVAARSRFVAEIEALEANE